MRSIVFAVPVLLALAACEQQKQPQQQQQTPPQAQSGGTSASDCLAEAGPLSDGKWFAIAKAWTPSSLTLDPACMLDGAAAAKAAAARGDESPPPNDFYIVNDSTAVLTIPVAQNATARRVTHNASGDVEDQNTTYADMVANPGTYTPCPGDGCTVWVVIKGGAATEVNMQYLP